jgi:hypothetical protein
MKLYGHKEKLCKLYVAFIIILNFFLCIAPMSDMK